MLEIWCESEYSKLPNTYSMALFSGSFETDAMTYDFFRTRVDQMYDLRHPLAVLAKSLVLLAASRKAVDNPPSRTAGIHRRGSASAKAIAASLRIWRQGGFGDDAQGQLDSGSQEFPR